LLGIANAKIGIFFLILYSTWHLFNILIFTGSARIEGHSLPDTGQQVGPKSERDRQVKRIDPSLLCSCLCKNVR